MSSILSWLSNPIGSAISAIGGVISNSQQAKENQKNRDWNEYMWNLNNAYNDPSAVRARLENAGMNPNLAYGSIGQGLSSYSGNLGTDNTYQNPLKGTNLGFIEAQNMENQTELKDSQVLTNATQQELNKANASKANEEAKVNAKIAEYKETENKYQEQNIILDLAKKNLDNSALELANKFAEEANPIQISTLREALEKAKNDKLISEKQWQKLDEEILNVIETRNLIKEEQKTEQSKQGYYSASAQQELSKIVSNLADAGLLNEKAKTERETRDQIIQINKETIEKLDAETALDYETALKLIEEADKIRSDKELAVWKESVRDAYGSNTATIMTNMVLKAKHTIQGWFSAPSVTDLAKENYIKGYPTRMKLRYKNMFKFNRK